MFDHIGYWRTGDGKYPELGKRKDMPCKVLARGKKNNILVEFQDGYRIVTCRYAVRLADTQESE